MEDLQNLAKPGVQPAALRLLLLTTAVAGLAVATPAVAQDATGTVALDTITLRAETGTGYAAGSAVSGTKTDTPLRETPASVSVVTAQQIGDQAVKSVAQALRYTAGVAAEYRGSSNIADEVYIRGFGYVPRYVDGMVMSGSGQQVDPWLLESVAAVKGPASLLYGQANPGGLIDATTKKANGTNISRAGIVTGSHSRAGARFDLGRVLSETLSVRVVGLAEQADTQETGLETRRATLAPSLQWAPTDATTITLLGTWQREPDAGYRNFREALGTLNPTRYGYIPGDFLVGDPDFEKSERTSHSLGYELSHRIGDTLTLRQKARISKSDWDQRTLVWGALDAANQREIIRSVTDSYTETDQATLDNQIEARLSFGGAEHVILGGVDIQYTKTSQLTAYGQAANPIDWLNPDYGNVVLTGDPRGLTNSLGRTRQTGVYLQDQITAGALHLQAGLRYDKATSNMTDHVAGTRVSVDSEALSGRIGALYELANGFSPYISYSTSFEPVTDVPRAGEAPFDPTEGKQLEIGVKWSNPDESLMVTASAYDLRQTNVLKTDPATSLREQVGEIKSRGFEIEAQGKVTGALSLIGSYAYNDSKISKSTIASEIGTHNDRVPRHQAALWGKYDFEDGWDVGLGLRYTGKSWARGNSFTVPGITLVDMAVGYDFGKFDPRYAGLRGQINVSNLFDEYYTASCASAYACWAGAERTITASLDFEW